MDSTEMLRSNQPIVHLRTRLSQEMFGTIETNSSTNTKQWYSYYRSSIADKMSDYEDIWEKSDAARETRCLSPAESELQFKAYLANKLANGKFRENNFDQEIHNYFGAMASLSSVYVTK